MIKLTNELFLSVGTTLKVWNWTLSSNNLVKTISNIKIKRDNWNKIL